MEAKQILTDSYDKAYDLDTGIAGVFMDPKEMPKSSSLYAARMREYADLKISRWYPNFLDYLALPAYLVEETVETARAVLDKETSEAATTAANIKNLMEGNKG